MVCFSNVYGKNKMAINEEDLSISVQKYTVLFDKRHKEFHRKEVKKNAWKNSLRSDILAGMKVETNAPEICSYSTMSLLHFYDSDDVFLR